MSNSSLLYLKPLNLIMGDIQSNLIRIIKIEKNDICGSLTQTKTNGASTKETFTVVGVIFIKTVAWISRAQPRTSCGMTICIVSLLWTLGTFLTVVTTVFCIFKIGTFWSSIRKKSRNQLPVSFSLLDF